jgi:hypothetical protein
MRYSLDPRFGDLLFDQLQAKAFSGVGSEAMGIHSANRRVARLL